jgi:hypothetical protein
MDRSTKITLWIAAAALLSYFISFFADCAMDDACRIVCTGNGHVCHTERTPRSWQPLTPHGEDARSAVSNHAAPTFRTWSPSFETPLRGSSG